MSVVLTHLGYTKHSHPLYSALLDNGRGLSVNILNYGGIIRDIIFHDKDNNPTNVVLGRETLEDYKQNDGYLGAIIGRHANRIAGAKFSLNGTEYSVGKNEGNNSLHGGFKGFDQKVWALEITDDGNEPEIELTMTSPDMEEGFPGELRVKVSYKLTADNGLKIHYHAVSDKDTLCNLTNHSYFNLAGHGSGNVYKQVLQINSGFYTPNSSECMPTGEILSVSGTPFDFRAPKPIGQDINSSFEQIAMFGGYDHNFAINGRGMRLAAVASCPDNGITMKTFTDAPAMQLYTSNGLGEGIYKAGAHYGTHQAFCLETQCFPNAMSYSHFPSPILKEGEVYETTTEYRFGIQREER